MSINFSQLKRKIIRKQFDNGIEIYNPDKEQRNKIFNMVVGNVSELENDIQITGKQLLLEIIPMITNIHLDLSDANLIDEILSDPSDVLLEVQDEIVEIVKNISDRTFKAMKDMSELPEHVIGEIAKEVDPKQKEIAELEKKLKELKG